MTLQEQRDVIQSAINGSPIQYRTFGTNEDWKDCCGHNILFNFCGKDYRVKPAPREGYVYTGWMTQEPARDLRGKPYMEWVKVREVI